MFCYIMMVQNVVYVLCINLYTLSKFVKLFLKHPVFFNHCSSGYNGIHKLISLCTVSEVW
jgi:hypothetical protein